MKIIPYWIQRANQKINKATMGVLAIVQYAFKTATMERASEAAASMAYYAFFSLFPMLLFIVAAASFILQEESVYQQIMTFVRDFVPMIESLIEDTIGTVIHLRGAVGLIGLVGLLWSATAFFAILVRNIDRALPGNRTRNLIEQRIFAIEVIAVVTVLLVISWVFNTIVNTIPKIIPGLDGVALGDLMRLISIAPLVISWIAMWMFFYILYRWVPIARVDHASALIGSVFATLALQLTGMGIRWLFQKGLIRYDLVYGSLGTVALLMLLIYIAGFILVFGAHLTASIYRSRQILFLIRSAIIQRETEDDDENILLNKLPVANNVSK
ncbi:MAG TPA: YihY/virulence factor BrkB family protein [Anaerolineaceae bacterium]|nr:YihY/virulence factor BrkB family protein [Anaerolineaceae bacterium]HOU43124.1 YihY/virulence factor BrkB family protein [Anaerolineaceae bacterium]HQF44601.1 YihY/virulence factor BrkB family protein [Anaerolineaceae bacterium]HQH34530.1 YihY/virulence factor BrkB family protein [Anaerolineaceae bacterium]HQJ02634.1 YihY/virulence factor BrkB family protein [Anaerolineaceae bacterium]